MALGTLRNLTTYLDERRKLLPIRHAALPGTRNLIADAQAWMIDIWVPISQLAAAIDGAHPGIAQAGLTPPIPGCVGDGNHHGFFVLHPDDAAGVRGTACLFNAMNQFGSREPGFVGTALLAPSVISRQVADGRHVPPAAIRLAGQLFGNHSIALVTDATSNVCGSIGTFALNGVEMLVDGYSYVAPEGTLAGSNLDMVSTVRSVIDILGVSLADACLMASHTPARLMGGEPDVALE